MPLLDKIKDVFKRKDDKGEDRQDEKDFGISDDEMDKYQEWIKLAEAEHDDGDFMTDAKRFKDCLKHKFPAQTDDDNQAIYNYYVSIVNRLAPELLPKEIKVNIKPEDERDELKLDDGTVFDNRRAAIIFNQVIPKILEKKQVKYALKQVVFDLLLSNLGSVIVGQDTEIESREIVPEGTKRLLDEKRANGDELEGEEPKKEEEVRQKNDKVSVVVLRESYKNVMIDPDSVDYFFTDKRYAIRKIEMPYREAKEKYPDFVNDQSEYSVSDGFDGKEKVDVKTNKELRKICFYEIYDYTGEKIKRVSIIKSGKKLIKAPYEFNFDPLAVCKLNYIPDEVYPPSDMNYYESLVDESNFYRTVGMNQVDRSAARKIFTRKDALDADALEKVANNKDMEIIQVDTQGLSIRDTIFVHQGGQVNTDIWGAKTNIENDIKEISQVSDTRMGNVPRGPATNATLADMSFKSNVDAKLDIIKDFVIIIVEKMVEVLKEISLDKDSFILEHPNGEKEVIEWDYKDIEHAKLSITINLEASLPNDVKMKRTQEYAGWLMQPAMIQGLANEKKRIRFFEFAKEVGKLFIPDANFDRLIIDDDTMLDPTQEDLMMMAGQAVQPNPNEDFSKHLGDHKTFVTQHPVFQTLPPQAQQIFTTHIQQTEALLAGQEEFKKQQAGPVGMAGQVAGGAANVR